VGFGLWLFEIVEGILLLPVAVGAFNDIDELCYHAVADILLKIAGATCDASFVRLKFLVEAV
jgi:hypothetical protein